MNEKRSDNSKHNLINKMHLQKLNDYLMIHIKGKLWLQIIIGMILGVIVGVLLSPDFNLVQAETSKIISEWLSLPGYFFLAVIQIVVIPLVFASILRGIAGGGSLEKMKKKGLLLVLYLLIASVIAVTIGIFIGNVLQPGTHINADLISNSSINKTELQGNNLNLKTIPKNIISIIPTNPLQSFLKFEMLQVVLLAFIFGFALLALSKKQAKPFLELMGSIQLVSMVIVKWVMLIAPLAVFGLMAKVAITTGIEVLMGLSFYIFSVLLGLFILMLVFLAAVFLIGKRNPFIFLRDSKEALLMAFSTDSSATVIPLSIKTAQEKFKVKKSTAQFIIPIGATVNMSGTALYQGIATIFMAQLFGLHLPLSILLALIVTAVGASIGTPATPGVGIVILSSVLTSAGIPLAGIPLILGVDRILEMVRTVLNVAGDLTACVLLDKFY